MEVNKVITNYRIRSARRVIENSFGNLAARFRIFRRPINATFAHVDSFTKASIALHKYFFFFFYITIKNSIKKDTNLQNSVPPKAGNDTESSSPHFEWHLQIFNYIVLKVQTSLAPNNAKNKLCFSFEKNKKKRKKKSFFFPARLGHKYLMQGKNFDNSQYCPDCFINFDGTNRKRQSDWRKLIVESETGIHSVSKIGSDKNSKQAKK